VHISLIKEKLWKIKVKSQVNEDTICLANDLHTEKRESNGFSSQEAPQAHG
jgi:hypothetical protein